MLSITELPVLALLFPAAATLLCSALGRPWPRHPAFWARWVLRAGLLLGLADAIAVLDRLQPGGALQTTLWRLDSKLPISLSVDTTGTVIAILVLVSALVVSFAARDRRPLTSAALGLAALGAVGAAFSGDLLGLYIGLQLSTLGGIGLSYARQPRAASSRMVWAASADQAIGLVWLGAMVLLLHQTATLQLNAIPTSSVGPALSGLLLLPAVVRLAGCGLVAGSARAGRQESVGRSLDVADWLAVVGVPTILLLLVRIQSLSGGSWPVVWFGTCLDLLALGLGLVAVVSLLASSNPHSALRSLLLLLAALVVVGFGQNSADGTLLALTAGLFLEISSVFLPRAMLSRPRRRRWSPSLPSQSLRVKTVLSGAVTLAPCWLGLMVALLGLDLAFRSGLRWGVTPALAYSLALAGLVLTVPRLLRESTPPEGWSWVLWLPVFCLAAAVLLPGWAVTVAAAALAPPGTLAAGLLSAPDPLVIAAPGLLWPGGYLVLLSLIAGGGLWALWVVMGGSESLVAPTQGSDLTPALARPTRVRGWVVRGFGPPTWAKEARGWYSTLARLADREAAERPVWLWIGATAMAAYLLAEMVRL
ncbi:MAG TPA: hypothetical protein VNH82_02645 [Candidatus Dormibacteraeota bacterium]|nr:hypothetical protein [Candidatus Dormibacteraeota bacterium]